MKFGIDVPNYGVYSDPKVLITLAKEAEDAGWDGFFIWDHIALVSKRTPIADPWIALAAIAISTKRICIGPMITPLSRRRPWKLARETVTLDHLSEGRLILGVGLGALPNAEFSVFGDEADPKRRADRLDEGLEIVCGLWQGEPFSYEGKYYQVEQTQFKPGSVQKPRIPIWVAGTWPKKRPLRRAAKWDGVFPLISGQGFNMMSVAEAQKIIDYVKKQRQSNMPYDYVHWGITSGEDVNQDIDIVTPYGDVGVTWWLENINLKRGSLKKMRERIGKGPPTL